ncbi:hypothetical protein Sjap_023498 [Stephania japonica]|uniref:non-specific serine/threonine protein kinase n=1 Tax=Stephania japonica TaxID=461633 RepID=A0AAP0EBP7_9MAGN
MPPQHTNLSLFLLCLSLLSTPTPTQSLDFLYNSFKPTDLTLIGDARIDPTTSTIRLTNDSNQFSIGRAFHPQPLSLDRPFSTSFVFSILPQLLSSPGFGLAFVLSNTTDPPNAISGQFFGLFSNSTSPPPRPLLAVEFDTGRNTEFNDPDDDHVGIDLNNPESALTHTAGYFNSSSSKDGVVPIDMKSGQNIRAWIDFDPTTFEINVTIAPITVPRPPRPLISYRDSEIRKYVSPRMFVGFSASKVTWVEVQRVLAWSLSDVGPAREINTSGLPVFLPETGTGKPRGLSRGGVAGVSIGGVVFVVMLGGWGCVCGHGGGGRVMEMFSYEELVESTKGFSTDELLGSGGFGRVYRATLRPPSSSNHNNNNNNNNNTPVLVAVKCVSHDSKQGFREFMAEISSPKKVLNWEGRRRVLIDVAEGLSYLHHGWDQVVLHRDIKSSNILLDSEMRARLGDFGLAKLYQHGQAPNTTRVAPTTPASLLSELRFGAGVDGGEAQVPSPDNV